MTDAEVQLLRRILQMKPVQEGLRGKSVWLLGPQAFLDMTTDEKDRVEDVLYIPSGSGQCANKFLVVLGDGCRRETGNERVEA